MTVGRCCGSDAAGDVAARLVQEDVAARARRLDPPAVDADVVGVGIRLRSELRDGRAVDRDAALRISSSGGAARRDAGGREDLLKRAAS